MTTYLLTWNPDKWPLRDMQADIHRCHQEGYLDRRWSCGRNNRIQPDDRVVLLRQGREPRGLIGSGQATSHVFEDLHWNAHSDTNPALARYIDVRFDVLLDSDHEVPSIFQRDWLDHAPLSRVHWNTQMSGILIPDDVAPQLELEWARFLASQNIIQQLQPSSITRLQTQATASSTLKGQLVRLKLIATNGTLKHDVYAFVITA